jgi:sulfatase maturation enzyme AslB (radical SAM superfamily)
MPAFKFEKVHIEITNICNLQCSFCPEVIRTKKIMDLHLFSRIVEQIAPLTEQVALHLMGDPLLHPKLKEIIDICDSHSLRIFFVTNGVLLRADRAELLLHPAFRQVNFSLHSFHDNFGNKDPSVYLDRILAFTEKAFLHRPDLYINYRLWNLKDPRHNSSENRSLLERVTRHFRVKMPTEIDVTNKKSYHLLNRLYLHFDTEFVWPSLDLPVIGTKGTCYGLRSHFGILVDGTIVPCCLDKEASIPLGHISEMPLSDILNGTRAATMIAGFQKHKLVEDLCQRCRYIERFS